VNLLKNDIPMEQAKALASILKEHPTLKSLCGNSGEETELDMSGKDLGAVDVIMLAPEIAGNGALTSLDVSDNNLGQLVPSEGWTKGDYIRYPCIYHWSHTDGRKEEGVVPSESKPAGIIALADVIPDMRALIKLGIRSNAIGAEQERGLQRICVAGGIELVK
jgi:hypothetical protein